MAHSGEVAVALVDAVDESLQVPGDIMTTTIRQCTEGYFPRRQQIPTELETGQHALDELRSACACMDFGTLVDWNVRGSLAVNFAEDDGWALVDYLNHPKEAKTDD